MPIAYSYYKGKVKRIRYAIIIVDIGSTLHCE